jgi:Acetyltransferase (GNAT) family.
MGGGANLDFRARLGGPDDYASVLDIQRRAYKQKEAPLYGDDIPPLSETPESLAEEIAGGKQLLVGESGGRIVASLRMKKLENGAIYFGRLSVDPDLQGRGIGQRMALAVEEFNPGAAEFVLDCGDNSLENRHIYEKLGYRETGKAIQVPNGPRCLEMIKRK